MCVCVCVDVSSDVLYCIQLSQLQQVYEEKRDMLFSPDKCKCVGLGRNSTPRVTCDMAMTCLLYHNTCLLPYLPPLDELWAS